MRTNDLSHTINLITMTTEQLIADFEKLSSELAKGFAADLEKVKLKFNKQLLTELGRIKSRARSKYSGPEFFEANPSISRISDIPQCLQNMKEEDLVDLDKHSPNRMEPVNTLKMLHKLSASDMHEIARECAMSFRILTFCNEEYFTRHANEIMEMKPLPKPSSDLTNFIDTIIRAAQLCITMDEHEGFDDEDDEHLYEIFTDLKYKLTKYLDSQ